MYVKRNLKVLQLRQDNKLNKQTIIVDLSAIIVEVYYFKININRIIIPRLSGGGSKYRPGGSNIKLIGSGSDRVGSGLVRAEILVGP